MLICPAVSVSKPREINRAFVAQFFFAHILDPKLREIRAFVTNSIFPIFGQI
jgi:hypothetical protein